MADNVIPFPGTWKGDVVTAPKPKAKRTCLDCAFASIGDVTYCRVYREEIQFERLAAADCEEFRRAD